MPSNHSITESGINEEFFLQLVRGQIRAHSHVHKFGRNPDIDTASGYEAIWNGGGDYTGFDATAAEVVEVFSSDAADDAAGTGARTIELFGLDANFAEVSETVSLDGTTAVDTTNSYIRLHRGIVRTAGTGGVNAGTITARQKVTTANIFMVIPIGYNQTMIAAYTVPADKSAFLYCWSAGLAGNVNADCSVRLKMRPENEVFQVKEELAVQGAGSSYIIRDFLFPKGIISEKTDIVIEANTDVNNTAVAGSFDLVLVDN